jgi:RNA polymerase sigma-70 factor, ECF subfamily
MIRSVTEGNAPLVMGDAGEMSPQLLVRLYADDVWRYVSSKLRRREDAEDATMETFAHAIQNFDRAKKADSPKLWLLAIARNKVHDTLRKRYRRAESPLEERSEAPFEADNPHRDELQQALSELPDQQREVLLLMYVNGLSIREIARAIRRSDAATNSLLQRARQSLRERMRHLIEAPGGQP